jgi:hypothetical protein
MVAEEDMGCAATILLPTLSVGRGTATRRGVVEGKCDAPVLAAFEPEFLGISVSYGDG